MPKQDPRFVGYRVCRQHGDFYELAPDDEGNRQTCHEPPEGSWEGYDIRQKLRLCPGCLQAVRSGSGRFTPYFCEECRVLVRGPNAHPAMWLIPVGPHSLMNGIGLAGPVVEAEIDQFVASVNGMFARQDMLFEARRQRLGPILAGFDEDPTIDDLIAAAQRYWTREEAIDDLQTWWLFENGFE